LVKAFYGSGPHWYVLTTMRDLLLNSRRCIWLFAGICLLNPATKAQIIPGYRGQWNSWGHTPMTFTNDAWRVTMQAAGGGNAFKIAPANWDDGDWTYSANVPLGNVVTIFPGGGLPDSSVASTAGRYYSFSVYQRAFSTTNSLLIQETINAPVSISSVSTGTGSTHVSIAITTSITPGSNERIFVRYSTNNWASSAFVLATGSGSNWSATIEHDPSQSGSTSIYYALSSTVTNPSHQYHALQTIRFHDNDGLFYSYIINAGTNSGGGGGGGEEPPTVVTNGTVHINEVVSSNTNGISDEDGQWNDWIELYNPGTNGVQLSGWGLSDSATSPFKWIFGNVIIQPGEFLLIWASDKNRNAVTNGNQLHTSYGISSGGEAVVLTRPDGTRVDYFDPIVIPANQSLGRQPDGTGPLLLFSVPTPRAANTNAGILPPANPPQFSMPAGMYTSNITVAISSSVTGGVIRYTLDGSEPSTHSPVYSAPLNLGSKAGTTNNLSTIPTNFQPDGPPFYEGWEPPAGEVFKFHTVRARVFADGASPSLAATRSYIIDAAGTNRYTLPVVSIVTDARNFFDPDIGIYVPGNFNNMTQSGSDWERPGTIEFFEKGGALAFTGNVGLRLHGNTTRTRPRKAIRVYARNPTTFNYQIYPDKPVQQFSTFILRNAGNDWGQSIMRDMYAQSLMSGVELDRQFGRPAIVFLNGEYWGIHDLRERFDEGYIQHNHGLDASSYTQLEIDLAVNGAGIPVYDSGNSALSNSYPDVLSWIELNSPASSSNYEVIRNAIDVDSFINFQQAHMFAANTDWPGNNVRLWRSVATNRSEGAPRTHDARWRYMLYDTDFGFGLNFSYVPGNENSDANGKAFGVFAQHDTLSFASSDTATSGYANGYYGTLMLRRLLENEDFKASFITRFSDQLNSNFSLAHVTNKLAQWVGILSPEISEHVNRWRQPYDWNAEISRVRSFAEQRTAAVWGHLQGKFNLSAPRQLTVAAVATQGIVRVNSIQIGPGTPGFSSYPWTGLYFTNYPVTLIAEPRSGYRFATWISTSSSSAVFADDARNNYSSWFNGSNEGAGFDNWILNPTFNNGNRGSFLADDGWGLYANNDNLSEAMRPLSSPLATGQTFAVRMQPRTVDAGRSVGVTLQNSAGQRLFELFRTGGTTNYRINDFTSSIAVVSGPVDLQFTLTGPTNFTAIIITDGASNSISGHLLAQTNQVISRFRAWNYSAGNGSASDFTFNNLKIYRDSSATTNVLGTNETIQVTLTGDTSIEATFEPGGDLPPTLVHYWSFNNTNALFTPSFSSVSGAAISAVSASNSAFLSGTAEGFAATNARLGDAALTHLRVNNPVGSSLEIALPTTGHRDALVKYEARRSTSGSWDQNISYTVDGILYTPLTTLIVTSAPVLFAFDFAEMPAADDNPFFGLRIQFAQGTGGGLAGNNRFDNLTLDAVPLPPAINPTLIPGGNAAWNTGGNWTGGTVPNAVDAAAILNAPTGLNRAVTISAPITVGSLLVQNEGSTNRNRINGTNLTFAATSGVAALTIEGSSTGFVEFEVTGGVTLATNLNITVNNSAGDPEFGALRLRQGWSGPGGLRKFGPGMVSLTGDAKSYGGETYIKQGVLAVSQPSAMTNSASITVLPGGQLRLTSATDINGPRIYAFGGPLNLNSFGRTGVPESENLGILGALRYEPGTTNSKAIVTTAVTVSGASDIHVATSGNELELAGSLTGTGSLTKSGGGRLTVSGAVNSYASSIMISNGELRVNGLIQSPIVVAASGTLSGSGSVGSLSGAGLVAPAGILTAERATGLDYAFVLTTTGMPVFASNTNSLNSLLRLRATNTPLAAPFPATSDISIFLSSSNLTEGSVYSGGFFTDKDDDFAGLITNVTVYIADNNGTVTNSGQRYRLYDLPTGWTIETVSVEADFTSGTITGRIMQLHLLASANPFDSWRAGNFSPEELADPGISGPYADPGTSGVANLYRYATGLDRNENPQLALPRVERDTGTEQNPQRFYYRRLSDTNRTVDYLIELNTGLYPTSQWREAFMGAELIEKSSSTNADGRTENVEVEVPDTTIGEGLNLRLKIAPR